MPNCKPLVASICGFLLIGSALGQSAPPKVEKDHARRMAQGLSLFKRSVRTALVTHCLSCHGGKRTRAELDITTRERLLAGGATGPAIIPGNGSKSLLYRLVAHQKEPYMPHKRPKLSAALLADIKEWIDLGAPYDKPLLEKKDLASWTRTVVPPERRKFWSFQPLRNPKIPQVQSAQWCQNPIDRFILARQEANGLTPNPTAPAHLLIRRLHSDYTGLPPTPEAVRQFQKDFQRDSAQAMEKWTDRLLASPRYGERWARHWLDLARFGESHGFEHDYDRPHAYHYRDFVIKAWNKGLSFDTFVKWQIAGDELDPKNAMALMATGFLAAGVHSTQITKSEVERHRYDELDDMLSVTGNAMLGLSIGCARCHDHKYDPIPQRDYYQMLSAFTTTVRSVVDLPQSDSDYEKQKAIFDRRMAFLQKELSTFEQSELPRRYQQWQKTAKLDQIQWVIPKVLRATSQGGATFAPLPDGSFRVSGKNVSFDTYTIEVKSARSDIKAIRVEAMADAPLVRKGPGRAGNGNFALTNLRLLARPAKGNGKSIVVPLQNARATFEQKGLAVRFAIDNNPKSAWAVDPQFGKDHAAVFDLSKPLDLEGEAILTFILEFKNNHKHSIGRPRISITSSSAPLPLQGNGISSSVTALIRKQWSRLAPVEKQTVLKWYQALDPQWQKIHRKITQLRAQAPKPKVVKALISGEGLKPVRLHSQGADFLPTTHFLRRGDPAQKEREAPLGFLQVVSNGPNQQWRVPPPAGSKTSFRRASLAQWLTDTQQGAGHLLARVIVNRLWQHHMGQGLVLTSNDFGARGSLPSHPDLLDWMAGELIRNGWRLKPLHRLITTSAIYAQSSKASPQNEKIDPKNQWLWRRPSIRLEAEAIRDTLLALGNHLDSALYGKGTLDPKSRRRSVYFTVKRSKLVPVLQIFDAPDALSSIGERPKTTVAPQALYLLNNPQVRSYAHGFARRLTPEKDLRDVVKNGFQIALARVPTDKELNELMGFINRQMASYRKDARENAIADFCQVLMCLNELIYID